LRKIASVGLAPVGAATGSYPRDNRNTDRQNTLALRHGLAPAGATIRCFRRDKPETESMHFLNESWTFSVGSCQLVSRRGKPETEIDEVLFATEKLVLLPNFYHPSLRLTTDAFHIKSTDRKRQSG
jgi:hypothetical protein